MKIKNPEWLTFKDKFIKMLKVLEKESGKFDLPHDAENFEIYVNECVVHPIFVKKAEELKVQYDFTLCDTEIRTLSFSIYKDAGRIEITLKNNYIIKDTI
jgi:hypothetical protein